jgi:phosphoglycolate phosphatase-like HAD superfamily hydrolase
LAAPQTKEYGFLSPGSQTSFLKHHGRDVKTTSRWKSRRAEPRALRYSCRRGGADNAFYVGDR